jgi:hypothetical protein
MRIQDFRIRFDHFVFHTFDLFANQIRIFKYYLFFSFQLSCWAALHSLKLVMEVIQK